MVKKVLVSFVLSAIVLLLASVVAAAAGSAEVSAEAEEVASETNDVSAETQEYVQEFVKKKGISEEEINSVSEVNFDDLPKEVNIENVDDTNLAIYEINYDEPTGEEKKVFVISYSVEKLKAQGDIIVAHDKRQFLNFGFDGEMSGGFLKTATGVEGSSEKGYVMMREGSITGISTNLEFVDGSEAQIIIYRNGEKINFGNAFESGDGVMSDYDVQSNGVVTFQPGDVISVSAEVSGVVKDVITMVEITTTN